MKPNAAQGNPPAAPPVYRPVLRQLLQSKTEVARAPVSGHPGIPRPVQSRNPQPVQQQAAPKPMVSQSSSRVPGQQPTTPPVSRAPQPMIRGAQTAFAHTPGAVQTQTGNFATLRIGGRTVHTAGNPQRWPVPMMQPPAGVGMHNILQPATTATLSQGKTQLGTATKENSRTSRKGGARGDHAEIQVIKGSQPTIKSALAAQEDSGKLELTLDVDTQVCDDCCKWFDKNLVSWLKKDAKVGSGKKKRDWKGTFSLKISANGGNKTISGTAATIAGLGGSNWNPVGEGYK